MNTTTVLWIVIAVLFLIILALLFCAWKLADFCGGMISAFWKRLHHKRKMKYIITLALGIPKLVFASVIFSNMWAWFIVPKFGLPPMSWQAALGVIYLASFLQLDGVLQVAYANAKLESEAKDGSPIDNGTFTIMSILLTTFGMYPLVFLCAYIWHCILG